MIEVALNGATTKAANPNVPRTPAEITADALACIDAGATIVHNHDDEPLVSPDGVHSPAPYVEAWRPIVAAHRDVLRSPRCRAATRGSRSRSPSTPPAPCRPAGS